VIEFANAVNGPVVCKTLSSVVMSEQGVPRLTYTTFVDPYTIDGSAFAATAHLVQEWVTKKCDARVTLVGHRVFAVEIHADSERGKVDWRSDYSSLQYHKIEPPCDITAAATLFLRRLGLTFGAFDFVITPDNEWVMLECNPAGQWLWLQEEADLEIAAGIADVLVSGDRR
jgi:hypothetical protein